MPLINKKVLVSGAEYFRDHDAINALMRSSIPVNTKKAIDEHAQVIRALSSAGIEVLAVKPPKNCQDGIYTANWGLVRDGKVILARLPNKRKKEEAYAHQILKNIGLNIIKLPEDVTAFSGQGDAIQLNEVVFTQSPFRTSKKAHKYLKEYLGFNKVIPLKTKPLRWLKIGPRKKNSITGWIDSLTYDIDLALAAIKPRVGSDRAIIAYCPSVFKRSSQKILANLKEFDKIKVDKSEALNVFALNLVSTGETVIMNAGAPKFKSELIKRGLNTIELNLPELAKGGGSIRCISLTID